MYSFYDVKSQRFDTPFFTYDELGAKRHFVLAIRRKDTLMSNFKDHYQLVHLGDFNIETGEFIKTEKQFAILEGNQVSRDFDGEVPF